MKVPAILLFARFNDLQWILEAFFRPQMLILQMPPAQKGKGVMKGKLQSPVEAAEAAAKENLSGAGQKISRGWNTMGRKCNANFAAAELQRVTPRLCL